MVDFEKIGRFLNEKKRELGEFVYNAYNALGRGNPGTNAAASGSNSSIGSDVEAMLNIQTRQPGIYGTHTKIMQAYGALVESYRKAEAAEEENLAKDLDKIIKQAKEDCVIPAMNDIAASRISDALLNREDKTSGIADKIIELETGILGYFAHLKSSKDSEYKRIGQFLEKQFKNYQSDEPLNLIMYRKTCGELSRMRDSLEAYAKKIANDM